MYCTNCGTKLPDRVKFCSECGEKLPPPASESEAVGASPNASVTIDTTPDPSSDQWELPGDEPDSCGALQETTLETMTAENSFSKILRRSRNNAERIAIAAASIANEDLRKRAFLYNESDKANKKFHTAMSTHPTIEADETPIFLYDDTAFLNGKNGVLITDKKVYINNFLGDKASLNIDEVKRIFLYRDKLFMDRKEIATSMLDKIKEKNELCALLNLFVYMLQTSGGALEKSTQTGFDIGLDKYLYLCNTVVDLLEVPVVSSRVCIYEETDVIKTKFANAIASYASIEKGEYPLVLYDNSITGNGKRGILITNKYLYASIVLTKPMRVFLPNIKDVSLSSGELLIEPYTEKIPLAYIDAALKEEFALFIKAVTCVLAVSSIDQFQEDVYDMSMSEFEDYVEEILDDIVAFEA